MADEMKHMPVAYRYKYRLDNGGIGWSFEYIPGREIIQTQALYDKSSLPLIKPATCTWTHDDDEGSWDAECGERWVITNGTPEENNFRFCPGCGKTIKTIYSNRREVNDE